MASPLPDLPDFGLAGLLRTALEIVISEVKRTVTRFALLFYVWLCTAILLLLAIGTCVVIGVVHLGSGLFSMAREYITLGWLADLVVGGCLLLIPALVLAFIAMRTRARRLR